MLPLLFLKDGRFADCIKVCFVLKLEAAGSNTVIGLLPPLLADMSCNCIFFGVYGTTLQYLDPSNINHATAKLSHVYAAGAGYFRCPLLQPPSRVSQQTLCSHTHTHTPSNDYNTKWLNLSTAGGFAQAFVVAPTELAKIRLQLQTSRSVESRMYKSTLDCFLKVLFLLSWLS